MRRLIITIDGPGGTGKSSVAREVASRLGLPFLDTGAYYRAATLAVLRRRVDPGDAESVAATVAASDLDQELGVMFLDGEDVSDAIRGPEVEAAVSAVAANARVRALLVGHQRAWADRHGHRAVLEGRDIGSVVFPEAEVKVYLDARPEVRARRRALQSGADPEAVHEDLEKRDRVDSTRAASPLTVAEGAIVIDTSDRTLDEVVDEILRLAAPASG